MKLVKLWFLLLITTQLTFAQVGRHELPSDTTPIGGEEQREKMNQMNAQEALENELTQLRDSIAIHVAEVNETKTNLTDDGKTNAEQNAQVLTQLKEQLDEMIDTYEKSPQEETLTRRAYHTLHQTRKKFNLIRTEKP